MPLRIEEDILEPLLIPEHHCGATLESTAQTMHVSSMLVSAAL